MKVTSVKCIPVHPGWRKNWIFVKVETDDGHHGWGEAYSQYDRDRSITAHVEEMGRYLVGRDPFHIKHFTQIAFDDYAARRGSLEFYSALSGIEAALWDIVGKATGQPVYNLLGGPVRDRIRVYANGWYYKMTEPDEYARAAEKVIEQGFTALKMDPVSGPWRNYISRQQELRSVEVLKAVRDAVGPDVDILLDLHRRLSPMHAISLAARYEEFEPYYYEEPCMWENVEALAEIKASVNLPIVTGEAIYAKAGFRPIFQAAAADIINPDVASCGGILELKEIAAMAEPYYVAVSPHNYNSTTVALAATVQASALMPNFVITEYFLPFVELGREICPGMLAPVNGYIDLPTAPGLGVDLDEEALARHPGKPFPLRALRFPKDEGP
ncbi:MAG: mandelate racemase/muconate lactonizing enzyme family protein [Proteobacteria bacterium]|nr:mandelate racemase/muconate lactonizing enzyme family protein [Pseudomonadota bacterium]